MWSFRSVSRSLLGSMRSLWSMRGRSGGRSVVRSMRFLDSSGNRVAGFGLSSFGFGVSTMSRSGSSRSMVRSMFRSMRRRSRGMLSVRLLHTTSSFIMVSGVSFLFRVGAMMSMGGRSGGRSVVRSMWSLRSVMDCFPRPLSPWLSF